MEGSEDACMKDGYWIAWNCMNGHRKDCKCKIVTNGVIKNLKVLKK